MDANSASPAMLRARLRSFINPPTRLVYIKFKYSASVPAAVHVILHADLPLARRIEAVEAVIARDCNAAVPGGEVAEIAGGTAVFAGTQSPLTQAVGIGLHGPVPEVEIDRLEAFFRSRGALVTIDLCPLADPGL